MLLERLVVGSEIEGQLMTKHGQLLLDAKAGISLPISLFYPYLCAEEAREQDLPVYEDGKLATLLTELEIREHIPSES